MNKLKVNGVLAEAPTTTKLFP